MARASRYDDTRSEILKSVNEVAAAHGKPPSVRDLAERFGVGVATMHSYLQKLADEGMVEWRPGRHRSLHLTRSGLESLDQS